MFEKRLICLDLPVMKADICQRVSFAESTATPAVPMKRLTIDIPADLHTRLKIFCASRSDRRAETEQS